MQFLFADGQGTCVRHRETQTQTEWETSKNKHKRKRKEIEKQTEKNRKGKNVRFGERKTDKWQKKISYTCCIVISNYSKVSGQSL